MKTPPQPDSKNLQLRHLVRPEDLNIRGTLFGGQLLSWMDIAGAMAAVRQTGHKVVLLKVDETVMKKPIQLAEVVDLFAEVTSTGNTSIQVALNVWRGRVVENKEEQDWVAGGTFTYVAVNDAGESVEVSS